MKKVNIDLLFLSHWSGEQEEEETKNETMMNGINGVRCISLSSFDYGFIKYFFSKTVKHFASLFMFMCA